ncbi:hypothetical protein Efla_006923 [Eimeria flavescens]
MNRGVEDPPLKLRAVELPNSNSFGTCKKHYVALHSRRSCPTTDGHSSTEGRCHLARESHATSCFYTQPTARGVRGSALSLQNPLPALAVYVDVHFLAVIQMLRSAIRASLDEILASFRGERGRYLLAKDLHKHLERVWLSPRPSLLRDTSNAALCKFLALHRSRAPERQSTAASSKYGSPESSSDNEVTCEAKREDTSVFQHLEALERESSKTMCRSAYNRLPNRGDTLRVVPPPLELLAAFAASSRMGSCSEGQSYSTPSTLLELSLVSIQNSAYRPSCVVGLCVRSLLDLYVQAIRSLQPALLPEGSVVLMAAVNIPMMFRVLEEHQLLVQPLDLETTTLLPTESSLQEAVKCWGARIKAVVFSHLYGGISDIQTLVAFCTRHKLLLIEDCAESFVGELYRGNPLADVSLFSFGLIKTCTAAGGGIATVRSHIVAARMQSIQALYPFSSRWTSLKKLCVTLGACFLQSNFIMKSLLTLCKYDVVAALSLCLWRIPQVRGFPLKGELFGLLRFQPNAFLLGVLLNRLETWNLAEFVDQQARTFSFARRLQSLRLQIPGSDAAFKTFWLFPVLPPPNVDTVKFALALRENGLCAAKDASTLVCYKTAGTLAGRMRPPVRAAKMMSRLVYLPVNRRLTEEQLTQAEVAIAKTLAGFY